MRSAKQSTDIADLRDELRRVAAMLAALTNADGEDEQGSYTIKQFLTRHKLSESQYHALRRQGRAPRTMRTGSVGVRISGAAERDWVLEREREAAEAAANARPSRESRR
jgi:hypothetical protein